MQHLSSKIFLKKIGKNLFRILRYKEYGEITVFYLLLGFAESIVSNIYTN